MPSPHPHSFRGLQRHPQCHPLKQAHAFQFLHSHDCPHIFPPMACHGYPALLPTLHPQYFCACQFISLHDTLTHAPFCTLPLHSTPTQNRPCTRNTELCTGTQLPVATPHTRTLFPRCIQCAPTQSYSNTHARAGPTAPLTLRAAGDTTAQCSGTCLTQGAELARVPAGTLPGAQSLSSTASALYQLLTQSYTRGGPARKRGTRAVTDIPGLESSRTRDSGRTWPGLAPPLRAYLAS